jgi:hypothetical protein
MFSRKCDVHVRPLCLDYGAFSHVIDLAVKVLLLSFIFEIGVRVSGHGMDCTVSGEIVALVRRLTYLQRRWRWQIGLCFALVCWVIDVG